MRVGNTIHYTRPKNGSRGSTEESSCFGIVIFLVISLVVLGFAGWSEIERKKMTIGFSEAADHVRNLANDQMDNMWKGDLIHFTSNKITSGEDNLLRDIDFAVGVNGALSISRQVEYCQWVESYTERKVHENTDREVIERTYFYNLLWVSHPVPSVFFDQPLTHHNPQRNPFSTYTAYAPSARIGTGGEDGKGYTVPHEILAKGLYTPRTVMFDQGSLGDFTQSPATTQGFRYIGGGYFYSPMEYSTAGNMFRIAGRLIEGTLLDFQLGELFATCTPGDIRLHFEAATPQTVSVVARQMDEKGTLGFFIAKSNGYQVSLLHEGEHEANKMFERELKNFFWTVLASRVVIFLWSLAVVSWILHFDAGWKVVIGGLFLTGTLIGGLSCAVWGVFNWGSLVLFALSLGGFLVSYSGSRYIWQSNKSSRTTC